MYYKCVHTWVWSVTPSRVDTLYHQCINNVSTCDLQPATWAEVIQCINYVSTMYQHSRLQPATWAELIQCISHVSTMCPHMSVVCDTVSGWYIVSSMYHQYQQCINIVTSNPQPGRSWYNVSSMYQLRPRLIHMYHHVSSMYQRALWWYMYVGIPIMMYHVMYHVVSSMILCDDSLSMVIHVLCSIILYHPRVTYHWGWYIVLTVGGRWYIVDTYDDTYVDTWYDDTYVDTRIIFW